MWRKGGWHCPLPGKQQFAEANYHWFNGNKDLAQKLFKALLAEKELDAGDEESIRQKLNEAQKKK